MNPPATTARKPSHLKLTLLVVLLAFALSIALIAWRLLTPPAPFPIPPDLALAYPQALFDSPDNAWHIYQRLDTMSDNLQSGDSSIGPQDKAFWVERDPLDWDENEAQAASALSDEWSRALDLFESAVQHPSFVNKHQTYDEWDTAFRRLWKTTVACRVRAGLAERAGDEAAAIRDLTFALRGSVQVRHFATTMTFVTGASAENRVLEHAWWFVGPGRYRQAQTYRELLLRLIDAERNRFQIADLFRVDYGLLHDELERLGRDGPRAIQHSFPDPNDPSKSIRVISDIQFFSLKTARVWLSSAHREIAHSYAELVALAESDPVSILNSNPTTRLLRSRNLLTRAYFPEVSARLARNVVALSLWVDAKRRALELGTALQWFRLDHGYLPESLQALVPNYLSSIPLDPFDGEPIRAELEKSAYRIWSVGPDLTDSRGLVVLPKSGWDTASGDLVWRLEPPK